MTWLIKVARPGFWLTATWFYLLPLGGRAVWDRWTFWLGLFYVMLPLGLLIYGWNDLVDSEDDRRNPRKDTFLFGARPTSEQIAVLPRWMALAQTPFLLGFFFLFGPKSLVWWFAVVVATAVYNWPQRGFKNRPGLDMLSQTGYLLVFVLSSWLNEVPQVPWFTFVFGALFAMHSHLFGQIMDNGPDLVAQRRTTTSLLGVIRAKWLMVAFLAAESTLVWFSAHDFWISAALAAGACFFVLDALAIWRTRVYSGFQMRLFFLGWNAVALLSIPWVWSTAKLAPHSHL